MFYSTYIQPHRISGVMVSVFASCAVDPGFELQSGQTKDYELSMQY